MGLFSTAAATFILFSGCGFFFNDCIPRRRPVEPEIQEGQDYLNLIPFTPLVTTKNGKLAGYVMRTIRNKPIAAFEGIPYGKPPIGKLRFRSPVPVGSWKGVKEAKKPGASCLQCDLTAAFLTHGSEDCLYLNVYTPDLTPRKLLPVIVFIPGGGFFFGSGTDYGPSYLLDRQDVILITFNYRVGVMGFFSSGDDVAPGNWGMKDQALLLRWVQKNIVAFGGDPSKITLTGQSAGSVSVGLHLMSPQTRDIPYAAIMISGHPFLFWGVLNRTLDSSRTIAEANKCPVGDSEEMVECLRSIDGNKLTSSEPQVWKALTYPITNFGPVVESPNSKDAFLVESVESAYRNMHFSNVPVLMGLVQSEGDYTASLAYVFQQYNALSRESRRIFPYLLEYQDRPFVEQDKITRKLRKLYLNNEPLRYRSPTRLGFSKMMGARFLSTGIRKGMEFHRNVAPTYGYIFSYAGAKSILQAIPGQRREDWNTTHIEDLSYWLNSTFYYGAFTTQDREFSMVDFITNIYANFATKRKPVYTTEHGVDFDFWNPMEPSPDHSAVPEVLNIQDIDNRTSMIDYPYEEEYYFWKSLNLA